MTSRSGRVVAIGLDMLAVPFTEELMDQGALPALAALRHDSTRFLLDHGVGQATGLAWEHVASGRAPAEGGRASAIEFDPVAYRVSQLGTKLAPVFDGLDRRVVVFDAPYVDLGRAPHLTGVVGWGAHDPGVAATARPPRLEAEFAERFGEYPATPWLYATPWPSSRQCDAMGAALTDALDRRTEAALWLMNDRFPDWDLFYAVAGEVHSAIEGLWHGVDPSHPLHDHPSAPAAAGALRGVLVALDRFVGAITDAAGAAGAQVVAFSMGGMGPNRSDVPSMVLLPELLYRHAFGRSMLHLPAAWTNRPTSLPNPLRSRSRGLAGVSWVPPEAVVDRAKAAIVRRLPPEWRTVGRRRARDQEARQDAPEMSVSWQPAVRYRPHWRDMRAFALPSFYDGRVRINLRGREGDGLVDRDQYESACDEIEDLVRSCRDPRTGEPVVEAVRRPGHRDPLAVTTSDADLVITWRGITAAFEHPDLGLIGPVPLRRTGGHTGRHGVAYLSGPSIEPGGQAVHSSYDVVPTLIDLLGAEQPEGMSGSSLLGA